MHVLYVFHMSATCRVHISHTSPTVAPWRRWVSRVVSSGETVWRWVNLWTTLVGRLCALGGVVSRNVVRGTQASCRVQLWCSSTAAPFRAIRARVW